MVSVFAYGTLKRGGSRHDVISGSMFIRDVYIEGFDMYQVPNKDFPAIVHGSGKIHAELYDVTDAILENLNRTEGYHGEGKNNYYDRVEAVAITGERGWIYVAAPGLEKDCVAPENWIEGGNWDTRARRWS